MNRLISILLAIQILSTGQLSLASEAPDEVKAVEIGQLVPFSGFLISPAKAEKIRQQSIELDKQQKINTLLQEDNKLYSERLTLYKDLSKDLSEQVAKQKDYSFYTNVGFFVLGSVLTGALAYGTVKVLK